MLIATILIGLPQDFLVLFVYVRDADFDGRRLVMNIIRNKVSSFVEVIAHGNSAQFFTFARH